MNLQQLIENWTSVQSNTTFRSLYDIDAAATTGANFLGKDDSDPGAIGENIYSNPQNLPTAIASILNHAQGRANFHPAADTPEVVASVYNDYIVEIDNTPFFHILTNERNTKKYSSKNYNKLIDEVVNLYDGVSTSDQNKIKESIANMGKAIFGQEKAEQWKNLFSQATIDYSDIRYPKLYIYYTTLYMKHENQGLLKPEVQIQEFTVNRAEYGVLADMIRAYAPNLANLDKKNIEDWAGESSTPEKEQAKLCFDPTPVTA